MLLCEKKYAETKNERYKSVRSPFKDAKKRTGRWNYKECANRHEERTCKGKMLLTQEQKRQLTIDCASVSKQPLMDTPPKKLTNDPLHVSSGVGNHEMDEMRNRIRSKESDNIYFTSTVNAQMEINRLLKRLSLLPQSNNTENNHSNVEDMTIRELAEYEESIDPLLLPLRLESRAL